MIEVSIWARENDDDFMYRKPIIKGVDNTEAAIKLLPAPIKEMFDIWENCKIYRNKDEGLLMSMNIIFDDIRYTFNDRYWD